VKGWALLSVIVVDLVLAQVFLARGQAEINPGVAFSLGLPKAMAFFALLGCVGLYLLSQGREKIALFMVVIGGAGNMLMRVIWGGVVDYLPFFGGIVNNLSDYMIVGGVLAAIFDRISSWKLK